MRQLRIDIGAAVLILATILIGLIGGRWNADELIPWLIPAGFVVSVAHFGFSKRWHVPIGLRLIGVSFVLKALGGIYAAWFNIAKGFIPTRDLNLAFYIPAWFSFGVSIALVVVSSIAVYRSRRKEGTCL